VVTIPEGVDGGEEIEVDVGESATTVEEYERILAEEEFAAEAASTAVKPTD
jgi:copper chaperone CopZ